MITNSSIKEQTELIEDSLYDLKHLSTSFYFTGNICVSEKLEELHNNIEKALLEIQYKINAEINKEFKQTQENSSKLLKSILDVTEEKYNNV